MKKLFLFLSVVFLGFSCEEQVATLEKENLVSMLIEETHCANPWEQAKDDLTYKNNIKAYLESNGIAPQSVKVVDELPDNYAVCEACHCWSGDNIVITIPKSQRKKAEELGFSPSN